MARVKKLTKVGSFMVLTLLAVTLLTGCGGGGGSRTGNIVLTFINASNPSQTNLALSGKVALGGQTSDLTGSEVAVTFSSLNYGSYKPDCAITGFAARTQTIVLDKPQVEAELILVPENDAQPPELVALNEVFADGRRELLSPGAEIYRLSGFELIFSEFVEASGPEEPILSISSSSETIVLGPEDWQLSQNKLTFSPSLSWDSGTQSFLNNWEPGTSYTVQVSNLQDYSGNPFPATQILLVGNSNTAGPSAVQDLFAFSTDSGQQLSLEWAALANLDLWGYLLYRKVETDQEFKMIESFPWIDNRYLDDGLVNGVIYDYMVRAVDLNGNAAQPSAVVSATPASPQRGIMAFASDRQSLIDLVPDFDLYLKYYSASGSQKAVAITGLVPPGQDSNEDCPVWSPDGRRIAYTSTWNANNPELFTADLSVNHDGQGEIFSAAASSPRQLTFNSGTEASPTWSPDGRRLAYVYYESAASSATQSEIRLINLQTGAEKMLVSNGLRNEEPDWRPQGDLLVYCTEGLGDESFWEIHLYNLDLGTSTVIVPDVGDSFLLGDDRDPAFSPDGSRIAFASSRGFTAEYYEHSNIWVMDLNGGTAYQVTTGMVSDSSPIWSPDGTEIIFTRESEGQLAAIYRVKVSSGAEPQLIAAFPGSEIPKIPEARNWLPSCAK